MGEKSFILVAITTFALCASVFAQSDSDTAPIVPDVPTTNDRPEHFVPNPRRMDCAGTLEIQKSATINGRQIRIKNVVRWSDTDAAAFAPIGDLIVDQFDSTSNRKLSLDEIRSTLSSAGVNVALIHFVGCRSCLLSHGAMEEAASEPRTDQARVQQWIAAGNKIEAVAQPPDSASNDAEGNPFRSLKDILTDDLAQRLNLPVDQLQISFDTKDRSYLKLAEPAFHFSLTPRRVRDLGSVSWDIVITSGENQQKLTINADARCWEKQLIMSRGANYKQVLQDQDITERRVLVDHVPEDTVLTKKQIVGQQAARDLRPGVVLTARLVDPLPLARVGQFVSVTLHQGNIEVKTAAQAMEAGSYGQTIKLKNEQTNDVFEATLTGPQEAVIGPAPEPTKVASGQP